MDAVINPKIEPLPKGMTKQQMMELRDQVTNPQLMNAARGLNPMVRPGVEVAKQMGKDIDALVANNPTILNQYTKY